MLRLGKNSQSRGDEQRKLVADAAEGAGGGAGQASQGRGRRPLGQDSGRRARQDQSKELVLFLHMFYTCLLQLKKFCD